MSATLLFRYGGEDRSVTIDFIGLREAFDDNEIETCDLPKMDSEGAEFERLYSTPMSS